MINVDTFRRFMREIAPGPHEIPAPEQKRIDQQYMQRVGLAELILRAGLADSQLTANQKLLVAAKLSAPEVQTLPQRWADRFEEMAENERGSSTLQQIWALASDVCSIVTWENAADAEGPITQDGAEEGVAPGRAA